MKSFLICLSVFVFMGCGILTPKNPVCETDQKSVLCEASAELNMSLDDVAMALRLGNITGLSMDAYTAQQASDFIAGCKSFIQSNKDLTYGDFVRQVIDRYMNLTPAIQALFILASADYELDIESLSNEPLTEYDYYLILLHLDKQQALVAPFLLAE